jgi:hypothetical protein
MRVAVLCLIWVCSGCSHMNQVWKPWSEPVDSPQKLQTALEARWPQPLLEKFCRKVRPTPGTFQNLVWNQDHWEGILHPESHEPHTKYSWYASITNGVLKEYSVNVTKPGKHWLIEIGDIKSLKTKPKIEDWAYGYPYTELPLLKMSRGHHDLPQRWEPWLGPVESSQEMQHALEKRWDLTRLLAYCNSVPATKGYFLKNLPKPVAWKGVLYKNRSEFSELSWEASVKNGRLDQYTLRARKGNRCWDIEYGDQTTLARHPVVEMPADAN